MHILTPDRLQRILLGLGIFFAALSIGFSTGPEGTQWFWQQVPFLAIALLLLSFFLIKGWLQLELKRQRVSILNTLSEQQDTAKEDLYHLLSRREKEVIELILAGKRNQEIADELFIALSTVKTHINNIYKILEVQNRRQAIEKLEGRKGINLD